MGLFDDIDATAFEAIDVINFGIVDLNNGDGNFGADVSIDSVLRLALRIGENGFDISREDSL
jgi:hypothetical protein